MQECRSQWAGTSELYLHRGAPRPMGGGDGVAFACRRAAANGQLRGGAARQRTRAWPRPRREEPRVRPPAPPGPRRPPGTRRPCRGGAGTPGAARPPSSFSTTSHWTDGPRAWVPEARSHRRRRHRPPRPARRPRRRPLHLEASRGCQPDPRPRACSAPRRRPLALAWTGSAKGEWAGRGRLHAGVRVAYKPNQHSRCVTYALGSPGTGGEPGPSSQLTG